MILQTVINAKLHVQKVEFKLDRFNFSTTLHTGQEQQYVYSVENIYSHNLRHIGLYELKLQ